MRPATACQACREGKRRCRPNREALAMACARCQKLELVCSLVSRQTRFPAPDLGLGLARGSSCDEPLLKTRDSVWDSIPDWPDPAWRDEAVRHYFEVVHDKHHALFHRPTFEVALRRNEVAPVLLYSVVALGSRFTLAAASQAAPRADRRLVGDRFAEQARGLLDMRDISVTTIQACILLGTFSYVGGASEAEALYYATAVRLALILDLPRRPCTTELERQTNLRVWWTLYMIDIWSSAGLQLPRQLHCQEYVELPAEEAFFLSLSPELRYSVSRPDTGGSIWGQMARLSRIWSEIHDLNKASVENHLAPMSLVPQISNLARRLQDWLEALPSGLKETTANLERSAALGLGASFCALHLGFHYYQQILFYQFMAESLQNPSTLAHSYAAECTHHAKAFCDLLYLAERTEGCKCLYAMVGHMLVVTSTVYVHMLLFGEAQEETGPIRARLEHNFEIVTELQGHWITLDTFLARLKSFHNACLYSIEHSFHMDCWMLRFILEHSSSVPEKFLAVEDAWLAVSSTTHQLESNTGTLQAWYSQALS